MHRCEGGFARVEGLRLSNASQSHSLAASPARSVRLARSLQPASPKQRHEMHRCEGGLARGEGLCPSDSPTRSLAPSLRARASFACARCSLPRRSSAMNAPLRRRVPSRTAGEQLAVSLASEPTRHSRTKRAWPARERSDMPGQSVQARSTRSVCREPTSRSKQAARCAFGPFSNSLATSPALQTCPVTGYIAEVARDV